MKGGEDSRVPNRRLPHFEATEDVGSSPGFSSWDQERAMATQMGVAGRGEHGEHTLWTAGTVISCPQTRRAHVQQLEWASACMRRRVWVWV